MRSAQHDGGIEFGQTDVEALVRTHIPLSLTGAKTFVDYMLPLILSLEGPMGMLVYCVSVAPASVHHVCGPNFYLSPIWA